MKTKILLIAFLFLFLGEIMAQTKPKTKPPTQKEAEEKMKENQEESDDEPTEEEILEMEKLGIKMPTSKDMPKMTDQQWQDAIDESERIVPIKDDKRIAGISKTPLTNATLPGFLAATHSKVVVLLKPQSRAKGEEIYQFVKTQHNSVAETGNSAASLWMMGRAELAIYIMGKACLDDPTNTDNLNNYAAMISMAGAEQLSLPILNNLNGRFPENSTILNNIGQAWFGLGDIVKSEKYLDSTIHIYAYHPQANLTKSSIEESKGNKKGAIEAAKRSIKTTYSLEKESRLEKLGYNLNWNDLNWNVPMAQDPLGLEKFHWPEYPENVEESEKLEREWDVFRDACSNNIAELEIQQNKLVKIMIAATEKRNQQLIQASHKGQIASQFPGFAYLAFKKLKHLIDGTDGQLSFSLQKKTKALTDASNYVDTLEDILASKIEGINENYKNKFGEGKSNPFTEACGDYTQAQNIFLGSANAMLQQKSYDYLGFLRRKLNDEVYYKQYTMWPEDFEVAKVNAKKIWLGNIAGQKVMFKDRGIWCQSGGEVKQERYKLLEFDDVHCDYHSKFESVAGTITIDCSRWTTELDVSLIKIGLKQDMDKETFGDQFMGCTVEVQVGIKKELNYGPVKAEAKAGGGIELEFDRSGLKDVVLSMEIELSVGTDAIKDSPEVKFGVGELDIDAETKGKIQDISYEVGVEAKISLISGKSSTEGIGILKGVKLN